MKVKVKFTSLEEHMKIIESSINDLCQDIKAFKELSKFADGEWKGIASKYYHNTIIVKVIDYINAFIIATDTLNKDLKTSINKYRQIDRLVGRSTNGE